jgi:predicted nucleotidyltransferase
VAPILPTAARDALAKAKARLQEAFGPRLRDVRVFGSRAWGHPRADSDVDVAVVIADASSLDRGAATSIVAEVAVETDTDLRAMVWSAAELDRQVRIGTRLVTDLVTRGVPV